jgi:hypothetical protein
MSELIELYGPPTQVGYQNRNKTLIWYKFTIDHHNYHKEAAFLTNKWYTKNIYVVFINDEGYITDLLINPQNKQTSSDNGAVVETAPTRPTLTLP